MQGRNTAADDSSTDSKNHTVATDGGQPMPEEVDAVELRLRQLINDEIERGTLPYRILDAIESVHRELAPKNWPNSDEEMRLCVPEDDAEVIRGRGPVTDGGQDVDIKELCAVRGCNNLATDRFGLGDGTPLCQRCAQNNDFDTFQDFRPAKVEFETDGGIERGRGLMADGGRAWE